MGQKNTLIRIQEPKSAKALIKYRVYVEFRHKGKNSFTIKDTDNDGRILITSDDGYDILVFKYDSKNKKKLKKMALVSKKFVGTDKPFIEVEKVVVTPCGAMYKKNSPLGLHTVILGSKAKMYPIWRSKDELFSQTVANAQKKDKLDVVINGVWFGGRLGIYAIAAAHSSMPSSETKNEGFVVIDGTAYGIHSPERYVNQDKNGQFSVGDGDPSSTAYMAVDGLCALIMNSLKYGDGNKYSKKDLQNPIVDKSPKPEHIKYLTQRNSDKLAALMYEDNSVGKVGFGITKSNAVIVIVQEHDADGISYPQLQNLFIENNCIHAFVLDGSDSVLLNYKGKNLVQAGIVKNKLQVSGIGFKHEC